MVTDNKQIDEREVRFEDMPAMLLKLSDHMKKMSEHIISISTEVGSLKSTKKEWLSLDMLIEYLPNHPAKQTVYGWMAQKSIPYYKGDKATVFLKSEIDEWLSRRQIVPDWWHERGKLCDESGGAE